MVGYLAIEKITEVKRFRQLNAPHVFERGNRRGPLHRFPFSCGGGEMWYTHIETHHADLAQRLANVRGIGPATVATLIADVPEPGHTSLAARSAP